MNYKNGGLAKKGEGIAKKGFAKGGMVAGVSQSQGKTLNQNVKKMEGDKVAVRGVGAARARTAMIY
jgi:hypothetical protein